MKLRLALFIFLFLAGTAAFAQTNRVTGSIKNPGGEPLAGASILEKGTNNAAVSDATGSFTLDVSRANAVLLISFAGYQDTEVKASGQGSIAVVLQLAATGNLNDVVVIGYGTAKRKDLTGAIATIWRRGITYQIGSPGWY